MNYARRRGSRDHRTCLSCRLPRQEEDEREERFVAIRGPEAFRAQGFNIHPSTYPIIFSVRCVETRLSNP
jgi:hypothetical protein